MSAGAVSAKEHEVRSLTTDNPTLGEPPTGLLWDTRASAKALGIGVRTLARLTHAGSLPCVRIGSRVLYDPRDLTAWIDRQKKNPKIAAESI